MKPVKLIVAFVVLLSLRTLAQSGMPDISIVTSNISFLRNAVVKDNGKVEYRNGVVISSPGFSYAHVNYYLFRLTVFLRGINRNYITPLDVKLVSASGVVKNIHLEDDISRYRENEFYDFEVETPFSEYGWYNLEIGSLLPIEDNGSKAVFVPYDKTSLYVGKPSVLNGKKKTPEPLRDYKNGLR